MFQDLAVAVERVTCQSLGSEERGDDRPFPAYPYTHEMVKECASQTCQRRF